MRLWRSNEDKLRRRWDDRLCERYPEVLYHVKMESRCIVWHMLALCFGVMVMSFLFLEFLVLLALIIRMMMELYYIHVLRVEFTKFILHSADHHSSLPLLNILWTNLHSCSHQSSFPSSPLLPPPPASRFPVTLFLPSIMDGYVLRCNNLRCRETLHTRALVTTCSHVFCPPCADSYNLTIAPGNHIRRCPACDSQLPGPEDAVFQNLNPGEEYKGVLCGLAPVAMMEIVQRGLAFWGYQVTQEV